MIKEYIDNAYNIDLDNFNNRSVIVKYDMNRNIIWKNYIVSNNPSYYNHCAYLNSVKGSLDVYLYSVFYATDQVSNVTFSGSTNLSFAKTYGKIAIGVSKLKMYENETIWANFNYVNSGSTWSCDILHNNGFIYLYGVFNNEIIINGTTITKTGQNIYLIKYDIDGVYQWHSIFGGNNIDMITDIKIYNNIMYFVGYFNSSTKLDLYDLTCNGSVGSYICKLNLVDGKITSIFEKYSNDQLKIKAIEITNNKVYITGEFIGSVNFGSETKNSDHFELFVEEIKINDSKWQI